MFYNDDRWIDAPNAMAAFRLIRERASENQLVLEKLEERADECISRARRRPLPFYRGYDLIELELDVRRPGLYDQLDFQRAAIYALLSDSDARVLTGKVDVIKRLNELKDASGAPSVLDLTTDDNARDYLRFFCAFLDGGEGPFSLLEAEDDLSWGRTESPENVVEMPFDLMIVSCRHRFGWGQLPIELSLVDVEQFSAAPEQVKTSFDGRASILRGMSEQGPQTADLGQVEPVAFTGPGENGARNFKAFVSYGGALFEAHFITFANGDVVMAGDDLKGQVAAPQLKFADAEPILGLERPRITVTPEDYVEDLLKAPEDRKGPVTRVRIQGSLDLRGVALDRPLRLSRVEIEGDLLLDDYRSDASISLDNVAIQGRLLARRLSCSSFEAPELRVEGLYNLRSLMQADLPTVAVCLQRAVIHEDLNLEGASIRGGLDLSDLNCHGSATLSGVEIETRTPSWNGDAQGAAPVFGCNLSGARIGADLRLEALPAPGSPPMPPRRFTVTGPLRLNRTQVDGSATLRSMVVKAIDDAGLKLGPVVADAERFAKLKALVAEGHARFVYDTGAREALIIGSRGARRIGGGGAGVDLRQARIGGALEMGLNLPGVASTSPRTTIAGDIAAQDLVVAGELTVDGARIGLPRVDFDEGSVEWRGAIDLEQASLGGLSGVLLRGYVLDENNKVTHVDDPLEVHGPITLKNAAIRRRAAFWGADIHGDLNASSLRIEGAFDLDMRHFADKPTRISGNLLLAGAEMGGELRATAASIKGAVQLVDATLRSRAVLNGLEVGRSLDAGGVRIAGDLNLGPDGRGARATISGNLVLANAEVSGPFAASALKLGGSLAADRANFGSFVSLAGADIGGSLSIQSARVADMFDGNPYRHYRTTIGGDLILSNAEVVSDLRFCGARIGGQLKSITGSFARIQLRATWLERPPEETSETEKDQPPAPPLHTLPELHDLLLQDLSARSLDMHGLQVAEDVRISRVTLSEALGFFHESPALYLLGGEKDEMGWGAAVPAPSSITATIGGVLELRSSDIKRDLILTNLRCGGAAHLYKIDIGGDLLASAAPVYRPAESGEAFLARFARLEIDSAKIGGDALMEGVALEQDLLCTDASVTGEIRLSHLDEKAGRHDHIALPASSRILAPDLRTRKLTICGDHDGEIRFDLTRAAIDFLEVHRDLPNRLNLNDAQVKNWRFSGFGDTSEERDRGQHLRRLLSRTSPFDRLIYSRSEKWLRAQGDDDCADEIHQDMSWRWNRPESQRDEPGLPPHPSFIAALGKSIAAGFLFSPRGRSILIGAFTKFWTAGGWLLRWAGIPLALISLCIVTVPENIAPSSEQLSEQNPAGPMTRDDFPTERQWSVGEAMRVFVTNHVPIVPVVATPRWELADNRPLFIRTPLHDWLPADLAGSPVSDCVTDSHAIAPCAASAEAGSPEIRRAWRIDWIEPAGYGLVVKLLHWIAWPLALIGIAANFQRRRELD